MDRIPVGNDLAFRVGLTGHSGHLYIEPLPPVEAHNPLRDLPDFVLVSSLLALLVEFICSFLCCFLSSFVLVEAIKVMIFLCYL